MDKETQEFIRHFTLRLYEAGMEWDRWIRTRPEGPDKELNIYLLRLSRGMLKAVRIWRNDKLTGGSANG